MIVLDPERVTFDGRSWDGVLSVVVDREAERLVEAWSDAGPWCAMADVAQVRVKITLTRRVDGVRAQGLGESLDAGVAGGAPSWQTWDAPRLGAMGTLRWTTSVGRSDRQRARVSVRAVVTGVRHRLGGLGRRGSAGTQGAAEVEVTLVGVAPGGDGAADPVIIETGPLDTSV